jgi:hypothetical protein
MGFWKFGCWLLAFGEKLKPRANSYLPIVIRLLISQRHHRIEIGGFDCGVDSEE